MNKSISIFHKTFNIFLSFVFVLQSFAPALAIQTAYAQEVTPEITAEPTQEATPTEAPTPEITITPTEEITPVPSENPTPTVEEVTVTPEPTIETQPSSQPAETNNQAPTNENAQSQAPPASPTVTTENQTSDENAGLSATILENISAPSIDLLDLSATTNGQSASIVTDKADYAPTDTALITGSGFTPNKTYSLTVSSSDAPATSTTVDVTADANGGFIYAYQLDGTYRPNYSVVVKDGDETIATTTFTDSDTTTLFPTGQGTYTGWDGDEDDIDETGSASCGTNDGVENISENNSNDRESVLINLSTIPDGSTITSINVNVTYRDGDSNGSNGTFQTFTRLNGTNLDSGVNLVGANTTCTSGTQTINVADTVKGGATTLEVGVIKTATDNSEVWIGTINAVVTYTEPAGPTPTPTNTPTPTLTPTPTPSGGNAAADLDQCANDPAPSSHTDGCNTDASEWVNGNLGESKSVYVEGDSIAYRMTFDNLSLTTHNVVIEWDTTKSGKHAIDYLTTFNRTVGNADPCLGVSGCGAATTYAIPDDSQVTGAGVTPVAGNFTMYGGTITGVSAYTYPDGAGFAGDKSAQITITFTASQANPVLAWGGHIATRQDWGPTMAATSISGSPYHTRLIDLDGSGGNQDRSLAAAAVIFPATVTIVKNAVPDSAQDFAFTTTGVGLTNFSLDDDADGTLSNTQVFSNITDFAQKTVTESSVAGWALTGLVCTESGDGSQSDSTTNLGTRVATLNVQEGENISCTYTNTQTTGTITVNKTLSPSNDSGLFNLQIDGSTAGTGANVGNGGTTGAITASTVGTHTVSETAGTNTTLANYTTTYSCNNNLSGNGTSVPAFSITNGQNVVCTFTNTLKSTHLTLVKTVTNDNGGTADETDWTLSASGPTPISGATGNSSVTNALVNAGTYTLSESNGPAGYAAGNWSCVKNNDSPVIGSSIDLSPGDNATCTINNNDVQPKLTVTKVVVNDNGGTKVVSDFPLFVGATSVTSGVQNGFNANSYVVSETQQTGYTQTSITGDCDANGNITLAAGDVKACTITNNDNVPALHLRKTITNDNGGSALETAWTLTATGTVQNPTNLSGSTPVDSDATFKADTYALAETNGPAGYTAGAWDCGQATMTDATHVVVPLGANVTCTINNNDREPSLTLIKEVTNNNGGSASASMWTLTASGPTGFNGTGPTVNNGASFDAGTYNLSESGPAGYAASDWVCTGGTQNDADTVTVGLGQSVSCTITNDDIAPTLKLVKVVTKDNGGTAVPANWNLTASGTNGFTDAGNSTTFHTVLANTTYTLSESGPNGYDASAWSCNGGNLNGNQLTLSVDEDVTCTITNDDQQGTLIVRKVVINDNGGTLTEDDFSFQVNGGTAIPFEADGENSLNVDAGEYDITEPAVSGYATTYSNCENVSIANGGRGICTVTNNDIAPQLHLRKTITNDNGGTATVSNFTLTANGTEDNDLSGTSPVDSDATLKADTFALSENGVTGYSASDWICVGGTQNGSNITLGLGEEATCTITNDDQEPSLTLVKIVENKSLGTAVASDWTLTANGPTGFNGTGPTATNGASFKAGTYNLSESGPTNYTASSWVCQGQNNKQTDEDTVEVGLGEDVTCTITNTVNTGTIEVIKQIVSVNEDSGLFNLQVDEVTKKSDAGDNDTTGQITVLTGTHSVGEIAGTNTNLSDYVSEISCSNEDSTNGTLLENIQVNNGDEIVCTITNTRKGKVIVTKYNDKNGDGNLDDGENVLGGWDINLTQSESYNKTETTDETNGDVEYNNLTPGAYTLSETIKPGWEQTNIYCDNDLRDNFDFIQQIITDKDNNHGVSVGAGQTVNCSILNRATDPILTISKTNNKLGQDLRAGDSVVYTITLTISEEGGPSKNTTVTDLLPQGFVYQPGSYAATLNGNPFAVSEPTYASPGTWTLGDLAVGDIVVMTYTAKINNDVQAGLYKDVAWAQGKSSDDTIILATAVNPGIVDTNFVGTEINVVKDPDGSSYKTEGEVLGASTYLPATGANAFWVKIAVMITLIGLYLTTLGYIIRRRYV